MYLSDFCEQFNVSENYIKTHWWDFAERQEQRGILVRKEDRGNSAQYYIDVELSTPMSAEEVSAILGYSIDYFVKNFKRIQKSKAKSGITLLKINSSYYIYF